MTSDRFPDPSTLCLRDADDLIAGVTEAVWEAAKQSAPIVDGLYAIAEAVNRLADVQEAATRAPLASIRPPRRRPPTGSASEPDGELGGGPNSAATEAKRRELAEARLRNLARRRRPKGDGAS